MTANHAPGCPAIADPRDGCSCLLREAPHDDPCDCDVCREAVAAQGGSPYRAKNAAPVGQRYDYDGTENPAGPFMLYADHVAALRACEARVESKHRAIHDATRAAQRFDYEQGRSDALDAATDVIRELEMPMPNVPMTLTYLAGLQAARRRIAALKATP